MEVPDNLDTLASKHSRRDRPKRIPLPHADTNTSGSVVIQSSPKAGFPGRGRHDTAIGAEKPIPEVIDHREIAIGGAVVNKMELLLPSEPRETAKP